MKNCISTAVVPLRRPLLSESSEGEDEDLIQVSASKDLAQASVTDAVLTEGISPVVCLTVTFSLKDLETRLSLFCKTVTQSLKKKKLSNLFTAIHLELDEVSKRIL